MYDTVQAHQPTATTFQQPLFENAAS